MQFHDILIEYYANFLGFVSLKPASFMIWQEMTVKKDMIIFFQFFMVGSQYLYYK